MPASQPSLADAAFGVHIDDVPFTGLDLLGPIEAAVGPVEIVHWYQAWGGGHGPFVASWFDAVADSGRTALVTWEPWALTGEASQPEFHPNTILGGDHDAYLVQWAEGFKSLGPGPWYVRPMHEMNGTWYPWAGGVENGSPASYIAAWRHIHDLFAERGVTNVEWVWCPLVDDVGTEPFEAFYPGGDVVDVLCLDGYNWGSTDPAFGVWRSPDEVFTDAYRRITSLGDQPVWLAEVGSAPEGGSKPQWVSTLMTSADYPRIEAVVWFDLDKERDWRIHTDPAVAEAIRTARSG